jgi:hypothetical protein
MCCNERLPRQINIEWGWGREGTDTVRQVSGRCFSWNHAQHWVLQRVILQEMKEAFISYFIISILFELPNCVLVFIWLFWGDLDIKYGWVFLFSSSYFFITFNFQ